jgi:hypothetical protein
MPVALYMDVHVPQAITDQLRLRGVDVLTAQEDRCAERTYEQLLLRAKELHRVIFTHDIRFHAMAVAWQRNAKSFAGLLFGDQTGVGVGPYVRDLELIAVASDAAEWENVTQRLPFK